nr:hypothetical protein [Mesorhizobium sp.]
MESARPVDAFEAVRAEEIALRLDQVRGAAALAIAEPADSRPDPPRYAISIEQKWEVER